MKNLNKFSKTFLYIAVLSGALWMGSYLLRLFIINWLFEENFISKAYINEQNLSDILISLTPALVTPLILYLIFIPSFILFLATSKINLKQKGWLFIITVLVFVTFPFEIYLVSIDYKIISFLLTENFNPSEVNKLVIERFTTLSGFPLIELFCYSAMIFLVLFRPLEVKPKISV
jgi:hypothetical protein